MSTIIDSIILPLQDDPNFISPPYLKSALYHGARSIAVYGCILGATVDVEIDSVISSSITDSNLPHPDGVLIHLPTKLIVNQNIRISQKIIDGVKSEWSSDFSKVMDVKKDYPIVLPRPKVSAPLYECSSRTFVSNLVQGGTVRILSEEDKKIIGAFTGCKESQSLGVFPSYIQNQKIRAGSEITGATSYESVEHNVEPIQSQTLKQPTISPIYEGAKYVLVEDVLNGADVHLFRETFGNISVFKSGSDRCFIPVEIPFKAGEKIAVWQSICSENSSSSSKSITVVNDHSLLPAPEVGPVQVGDNSILATNFVYGATLILYVNHIQAGRGGGPKVPLSKKIEYGDIIHAQQELAGFKSNKVIQIKPLCVNPPIGEDPSELDFYPVGISYFLEESQDTGLEDIASEAPKPAGVIYYPAEEDGSNKSFNKTLASKGPVPIVFIAHGKANPTIPSYEGFAYFQEKLAKMGIISVSINFNKVNTYEGSLNIHERSSHLIHTAIKVRSFNSNPNSKFYEKINFDSVGLVGHSRGGEAVIIAANWWNLQLGAKIKGVISLAPTNYTEGDFLPTDYDFVTILPAMDGDTFKNPGAIFYDNAKPKDFKCQLFIEDAIHNYFNRKWITDHFQSDHPDPLERVQHENILSRYGIAFLRAVLKRENTLPYLTGHIIPSNNIPHGKIRISFEFRGSITVDNHEDNNGVDLNSLDLPVSTNLPVEEHLFEYDNATFNETFVGHSNGIIIELKNGAYQSKLPEHTNILGKEIWVRAAEVFEDNNNLSLGPINFDLGIEDKDAKEAYINSVEVGSVPRPFTSYHPSGNSVPLKEKTSFKTLKFPTSCFKSKNSEIDLTNITSIVIRHKLASQPDDDKFRKLAVDDLQIVEVKQGLGLIDDLPLTPVSTPVSTGAEPD